MKVTIIVPIYNAEKYIEECIQGVQSQTFTNCELLLIDDGSTDNSCIICENYAQNDKRIRIIHKPNTGVSDTRNYGLDIAQGKYIIFLDADDYWYDHSAIELLVQTAEKHNLDIVRGEYKAIDQEGKDLFERPLLKSKIAFSNQVLTAGLFYTKIICGENFLVLSLIKRETIGELRFNKKLSFLEDMDFYAHFLLKPIRCMFIQLRFYAYRKNSTSASHTPSIKSLANGFSMCHMFNECCNETEDKELQKAYRYNSIMKYYLTLKNLTSSTFYKQRDSIIKQLSIESLQKEVSKWAKQEERHFPLYIYISPQYSIPILKRVLLVKSWVLRIGSRCKQLIKKSH